MRFLTLALCLLTCACGLPARAPAQGQDRQGAAEALTNHPKYIGSAWMDADGTIRMNLRAEGPGGIVGHALLAYPPGHPEYKEILEHIGPMQPGDTRAVPAWPD